MCNEIRPNCGSQKHASFFTVQVETNCSRRVLRMNDSRIHRNMKIARDDRAVKLGCSD